MQSRVSLWWWLLLALLLLAPGPAGRLLLDLAGGLTLLVLGLPLLLGGGAWIAWQVLQRRLRSCGACGFRSLGSGACPACGTPFPASQAVDAAAATTSQANQGFDARDVTVDVSVTDLGKD